jgi:hypothetical protein
LFAVREGRFCVVIGTGILAVFTLVQAKEDVALVGVVISSILISLVPCKQQVR